MWAKYLPDIDAVQFYKTVSNDFPECEGELNLLIKLKDIADRFKEIDECLDRNELAEPEYQIKYKVGTPLFNNSYKTHLQAAAKNQKIIGDFKCVYCPFRDKCAEDQGVELTYNASELSQIKKILKDR